MEAVVKKAPIQAGVVVLVAAEGIAHPVIKSVSKFICSKSDGGQGTFQTYGENP